MKTNYVSKYTLEHTLIGIGMSLVPMYLFKKYFPINIIIGLICFGIGLIYCALLSLGKQLREIK